MTFYVYILSNRSHMLYVGYTCDLHRRLFEHKIELVKGYTQRYHINNLVYYEIYGDQEEAERRETQLKGWLRSRKIELIETMNPTWKDLGFRFIYPESKAKDLLIHYKNKGMNGIQILDLLYKSQHGIVESAGKNIKSKKI